MAAGFLWRRVLHAVVIRIKIDIPLFSGKNK